MERLSQILKAHAVAPGGTDTKDKLLAASFTVVDKNGILYSDATGRLGLEPGSKPYTTESVSWIASMTKIITVTAVLQIVEKGLITLDEDLRHRVPQLASFQVLLGFDKDEKPILEDNKNPITLRNLLTFTQGLAYDLAEPDLMKWSAHVNRTENAMTWSLGGFTTPMQFHAGEGWYYGPALDWAGHVLERVTGKKLSEYMKEHIFGPLDMTSTGFHTGELSGWEQRRVAFNERAEDGTIRAAAVDHCRLDGFELESGGAGLHSCPADYAKFLVATLRNDGTLLKSETAEELFRPQLNEKQAASQKAFVDRYVQGVAPEFPLSEDGKVAIKINYGFGGQLNLDDIPGKRKKGSITWSGMTNPRWWIDRDTGIAAVMFTQILPHEDPVSNKLWNELEKAVYEDLLPQLRRERN